MIVRATSRSGITDGAITFNMPAGADRRMAHIQRAACAAAYGAMSKAGITRVDGIFSATTLGCLEDTERFLAEMGAQQGSLLSPLPFMRSTHNTMAGQLALLLKAQGPNLTFSQELFGLHAALIHARLHLREHPGDAVLAFAADEHTPLLSWIAGQLGSEAIPGEDAEAFVLRANGGAGIARIERILLGEAKAGAAWWTDLCGSIPGSIDHTIVVNDLPGGGGAPRTLDLDEAPMDGPMGTRTARVLAWVLGRMQEGAINGRVLLADRGTDQQGGILVAPC